jgi:putative DNA methylase
MYAIDTHFNETFADEIAQLESYNKHIYRPNTYLHKWWARRCGSTFRLILKSLVENEAQQDFYKAGGLEGKIVLDPMMGGGTTVHEAIRLGANVIGADIDPIPVLQARASLSNKRIADLAQAFAQFQRSLRAQVTEYFRTSCAHCDTPVELWMMLYALRQHCDCGESLVVDSLTLRHLPDGRAVRLDPVTHDIYYDNELVSEAMGGGEKRPLRERSSPICPTCHQAYREDLTTPYWQRYLPVALAGRCPQHKLFFAALRQDDCTVIEKANAQRSQITLDPAHFTIEPGSKSQALIDHNIHNYLDLFTSRQLLYLDAASRWLNRELLTEHESRNTNLGIRNTLLNLALLTSTSLEFNTLLCGYKGYGTKTRRPGSIRHAFTYHAYSFPYTALENNPLYQRRASGNLQNLFDSRIVRGRIWAKQPIERRISAKNGTEKVQIVGEIDAGQEVINFADLQTGTRRFLLRQGSSTSLDLPDKSVDFIVTDPPYFDSVQYSDLAAFFRVWLRQFLPDAVDWLYEHDGSAVEATTNGSGADYTAVLSAIFQECRRVLKDNGRFIFTFHHWNPKGWTALTLALKRAGFTLVNHYVVHAENLASRHIVGQNALVHDVILVCAPAEVGISSEWEEVTAVTLTDSIQFCYDCGSVLGWLLHSKASEAEIESSWHGLLKNK